MVCERLQPQSLCSFVNQLDTAWRFITNSDGEVLFKSFTIANNLDGFNNLYRKIESVMEDVTKLKVGLEATGHYSYNLLGYLFVNVLRARKALK